MKANKKTKVTIEGTEPELAEMLKDYAYDNYEERNRSSGKNSLYIRLKRIRPIVRLTVA